MSKLVYLKGLSTNLSRHSLKDGQILFIEDTGELYIDYLDSLSNKIIRQPIHDKELAQALQQYINSMNKVENKSSADIRSEITADDIENALGFLPVEELSSMPAEKVTYDNTESGLNGINVQAALDEVVEKNAVNQIGILTLEKELEDKASKTYVDTSISNLVDGAPEILNTLNELSAALSDDPNFATTVATQIGNIESDVEDIVDGTTTIAKATADANGNNIADTYATKEEMQEADNGLASNVALNRQTLGYTKKNLLKNTATSTTNNGVTFTVNEDGSVTANGTATADSIKTLGAFVPIPNAKYIFTGNEKVNDNGYNNNVCFIDGIDGDYAWHGGTVNDKKYIFTPKTNAKITCRISIKKGTHVDNLTFYPMIRSADITDGTYEPYVDDVDTRLQEIVENYATQEELEQKYDSTVSRTANTILSAPDRIDGVATFRKLVANDLPTVPITRGGTGATTTKYAQYNLLNDMNKVDTEVSDTSHFVGAYITPSTNNGVVYKRTGLSLWNYIKSKISTVLGLTETNYKGTATKATADANGNVIPDTYATKDELTDSNNTLASDIALNRQTLGYSKKNLLKNTATTLTVDGITFTVNDGSVTVNGTATRNTGRTLGTFIPTPNTEYIFTSNSEVSTSGYWNNFCYLENIDGVSTWQSDNPNNDFIYKFTPTTNTTISCKIYIASGTTVENLTFYPMIRSAEITDGTYEPYVDDVDTRLQKIVENYATKESVNNKVDKKEGKGLSTNDYTTAEKNKLSGIETGATKTTVSFDKTNHALLINP